MIRLDGMRKSTSGYMTRPIIELLARTGLTPNAVSWAGFGLAVLAAVLVGLDYRFIGGLVVLFGGFFDMLDGALARRTNRITVFGGILDSTLDRLAEAALLISLMYLYARDGQPLVVLLTGLAMLGSFAVSYVRARSEAAGLDGREGFFTRAERVVAMALGLMLSPVAPVALIAAIAIVTLLSFITVGQRLTQAWRQARGR